MRCERSPEDGSDGRQGRHAVDLDEPVLVHEARDGDGCARRAVRAEERVTRGRDLRPVIIALLAWGNKHFAPEGASVLLVDARTGREADPILVDRMTGRPLEEPEYVYAPGPAAGGRTRRKFAPADRERASPKREPVSVPGRRGGRKGSAK